MSVDNATISVGLISDEEIQLHKERLDKVVYTAVQTEVDKRIHAIIDAKEVNVRKEIESVRAQGNMMREENEILRKQLAEERNQRISAPNAKVDAWSSPEFLKLQDSVDSMRRELDESHVTQIQRLQGKQEQHESVLDEQVRLLKEQITQLRVEMHNLNQESSKKHEGLERQLANQAKAHERVEEHMRQKEDTAKIEEIDKGIIEQEQEQEKVEAVHTDAYVFEASVYDATLFAFSGHVDFHSSILIILGWLVNIFVLFGVSAVIARQFTKPPFEEKSWKRFRLWRATEGHLYTNANKYTGESMVARVCNSDVALSLASAQLSLYNDLDHYLGDDDVSQGLFLCTVTVVLWASCCVVEMRKTIRFILAIVSQPMQGWHAEISWDGQGFILENMSVVHVAYCFLTAFIRFIIICMFMIAGSLWLTSTTSITGLLLNASALGFLIKMDTIIFGVCATLQLSHLIGATRPLKYHARLSSCMIPILCLIVVAAITIVANVFFVSDMNQYMREVRNEMCSGELSENFISGTNELGWMYYAKTPPFKGNPPNLKARIQVTQLLMKNDPAASKYATEISGTMLSRNWDTMSRALNTPLEGMAKASACIDLPFNPGATSDALLGNRLWVATGNNKFKSVTTCAEVEEHCTGLPSSVLANNIRFMCPITCGCLNVTSGLWDLASHLTGCPADACNSILEQQKGGSVSQFSCEDTDVETLKGLARWSVMLERMQSTSHINATELANLTSKGCEALENMDPAKRDALCGTTDITVRGAAPFCPLSCRCIYLDTATTDIRTLGGACLFDGGQCRATKTEHICKLALEGGAVPTQGACVQYVGIHGPTPAPGATDGCQVGHRHGNKPCHTHDMNSDGSR